MNKALISLMIAMMFFVVSCGGGDFSENFPNEHGGLNWSDKSPNKMTWNKAIEYCKNLGGRLPTISELRTLIENCPATETGGECGVTDSCLSYDDCRNDACDGSEYFSEFSVFGDNAWFWSSSRQSDYADNAWRVYFDRGGVGGYYRYNELYFRCVW